MVSKGLHETCLGIGRGLSDSEHETCLGIGSGLSDSEQRME